MEAVATVATATVAVLVEVLVDLVDAARVADAVVGAVVVDFAVGTETVACTAVDRVAPVAESAVLALDFVIVEDVFTD